jgi:hypothetical protein
VRLRLLSDPAYAAEMHRAGLVWLFRQQQSDVLRYLQKRLPFPASLQLALLNMPAAGADILEDVVDGILAEAMGLYPDPPRDAADFRKACDQARASLFEVAEKRGAQLRELLAQRDEVREALDGVTPCHLQADLALQESMLWSPGWVRDPVCLNRYPKYLRGMLLRISRCLRDPQKDEFKQRGLDEVLESLAEHSGRLNPRGLREAFLKVEELRLTVFAPELRPHEKAGAARVIRWLEERV